MFKTSSLLMMLCLFCASCVQKEAQSIDQHTTDISKSADRIAESLEHFEEMMVLFIKLQQEQYKTKESRPTAAHPYSEDEYNEDFDF